VDDIESESIQASALRYLLKISNATSLEELNNPDAFRSVKLDFRFWDDMEWNLGALRYFS
jgi:hypothetical protein